MKINELLQSIAFTGMLLVAQSLSAKEKTYSFSPDTDSVLKNPLTGWVMYLGRNWDDHFWSQESYDAMPIGNGKTVKVSDYASTCYLRTSWSSLEPEEGKYVWLDKNSRISKLLQSVRSRNLRLAFRIVIDSRDQGQIHLSMSRRLGRRGSKILTILRYGLPILTILSSRKSTESLYKHSPITSMIQTRWISSMLMDWANGENRMR